MTTAFNSNRQFAKYLSRSIAIAAVAIWSLTPVDSHVVLAQDDDTSRSEQVDEDSTANNEVESSDIARRDRNRLRLGVMIAPSPGGSPLVMRVQPGSPADRAGIQHGDFILRVGGEEIDSPEKLQQAIAEQNHGNAIDVTTWRAGQERIVDVSFAAREPADAEPALDSRPWLGIMIGHNDVRGAEVSRVYVGSPADKAGLQAGDHIVKVNGKKVKNPGAVAKYVKSLEIGDEITLDIERDGGKQKVAVTVGNLEDFHERLFGERFRSKFDDYHEMFDPDFDGVPEEFFGIEAEDIGALMRELVDELKELRKEIRESSQRSGPLDQDAESTETS